MLKIAICDDENAVCSQIEEMILDCGKKIKEKIEIDVFYTGEKLLDAILIGENYDLIFLDIELHLLNGVEVGRKIREELKNESTQILYISAKDSYAMDLFEIRPMNFLIKPIKKEKVEFAVCKTMELANMRNDLFEFEFGKSVYRIPIAEILYFESKGRKINIITVNGNFQFYGKLKEIESQLGQSDFLNIHKSYLVNYLYVTEYQYEYMVMSNGEKLGISQQNRKEIRSNLLQRKQRRKSLC